VDVGRSPQGEEILPAASHGLLILASKKKISSDERKCDDFFPFDFSTFASKECHRRHKYSPRSWAGSTLPTTGIFEVQKQGSLLGPTTKLISALRHVDTIQLSRVIEHTVFATPFFFFPLRFRCHRLTTIPLPQKITTERIRVWTRTVLPESKAEKRISASAWYDYFFPPAHDSQSVSYHYFECHPLFSSITLSLLSEKHRSLGPHGVFTQLRSRRSPHVCTPGERRAASEERRMRRAP